MLGTFTSVIWDILDERSTLELGRFVLLMLENIIRLEALKGMHDEAVEGHAAQKS